MKKFTKQCFIMLTNKIMWHYIGYCLRHYFWRCRRYDFPPFTIRSLNLRFFLFELKKNIHIELTNHCKCFRIVSIVWIFRWPSNYIECRVWYTKTMEELSLVYRTERQIKFRIGKQKQKFTHLLPYCDVKSITSWNGEKF